MSKAKWTRAEDDFLCEHFLTKHYTCMVRGLYGIAKNYRLPEDIAARYVDLNEVEYYE